MGNWSRRKSKTSNGLKTTQTYTTGKGMTFSSSFSKTGGVQRITTSQGPKGTRIITTNRSGDMFQRSSQKLTRTARPKKIRYKTGSAYTTLILLGLFLFLLTVL